MTAQPTLRSLNRPCVSSPPPPPGSHPDLSCTLRPASDRSLASYSPRVHIHIYIYMILYHIFTIYGVRIHHLCRLLMHFAAGLIIILREFYPQIVTRSVTYCPVLLCIKKTDEGSRACRGIWSTCVGSRPVADDDGVFKKPSCPVGPAPRGVLRHRHPSTPARRAPRGPSRPVGGSAREHRHWQLVVRRSPLPHPPHAFSPRRTWEGGPRLNTGARAPSECGSDSAHGNRNRRSERRRALRLGV